MTGGRISGGGGGTDNHDELINVDPDDHHDREHDNEQHKRDFVDASEAEEAAPVDSVNGKTGAVEVEELESHGNESHDLTFAVDGDTQPPETHDNTAHAEDYVTESGDAGFSEGLFPEMFG